MSLLSETDFNSTPPLLTRALEPYALAHHTTLLVEILVRLCVSDCRILGFRGLVLRSISGLPNDS